MIEPKTLYNIDFALWAEQQAVLLKAGQWEALDIENLWDQVKSLGGSEKRELYTRFDVLIEHIVKLHELPGDLSVRGWRNTVREQARRIVMVLEDSPSLRRVIDDAIESAYAIAGSPLAEGFSIFIADEMPEWLRPEIDRALGAATPSRSRRQTSSSD